MREEMREQKQRARLNSSKKVRAIATFKKEVKRGLFNICVIFKRTMYRRTVQF